MEFHDGVEIIEEAAFYGCRLFKGPIKMLGVKVIKAKAFVCCFGLTDVEFGAQLERIEDRAFQNCNALKKIRMPSVRTVGKAGFGSCSELSDVEFGEGLRKLQIYAFNNCTKLKRIALPLKDNMIEDDVFSCSYG